MTELRLKHIYDNYTTSDQAEKILNLDIPINTADCYIDLNGNRYVRSQNEGEQDDTFFDEFGYTPCWSAGRLIEIWLLCNNAQYSVPLTFCMDRQTKDIVYLLINMLKKQKMDGTNFSLLKEYYE